MKENYTFNREKYKDILKRKGLTQKKVNWALGRSHAYASHPTVDKAFLEGLERYYGISGEDIEAKLVDSSKGSESGSAWLKTVDYDELYKCIYSAVYQAAKKAWSE